MKTKPSRDIWNNKQQKKFVATEENKPLTDKELDTQTKKKPNAND